MIFERGTFKYQICFIPTFGIISKKHYYGYRVFTIAFMWLKWGCSFTFGVKKAV